MLTKYSRAVTPPRARWSKIVGELYCPTSSGWIDDFWPSDCAE
ncbi:MAG TPA: hypothetical protein VKC52_05320 [Acidimicrobiia bacterium]|nr:hypothetical protein [Acidimicrobiia bacterium]